MRKPTTGRSSAHLNIDTELKAKAIAWSIPLSETLEAALKKRIAEIEDLEEANMLGGNGGPYQNTQPTTQKGAKYSDRGEH